MAIEDEIDTTAPLRIVVTPEPKQFAQDLTGSKPRTSIFDEYREETGNNTAPPSIFEEFKQTQVPTPVPVEHVRPAPGVGEDDFEMRSDPANLAVFEHKWDVDPNRPDLWERFKANYFDALPTTVAGTANTSIKSGLAEQRLAEQARNDITRIEQGIAQYDQEGKNKNTPNYSRLVEALHRKQKEYATYTLQANEKSAEWLPEEQARREKFEKMTPHQTDAESMVALAGQVAGNMSSPEVLIGGAIGGAKTTIQALKTGLKTGGIEGLLNLMLDPINQATEKAVGLRDKYDPEQTLIRGATGFGLGAVLGTGLSKWSGRHLKEWQPGQLPHGIQKVLKDSEELIATPWGAVKDVYGKYLSPRALNNLLFDKVNIANEADRVRFGTATNADNAAGRGAESPYIAARQLPAMAEQVKFIYTNNMIAKQANGDWLPTDTKGLIPSLQPVIDKGMLDAYLGYRAMKRIDSLTKRGLPQGYTPDEIASALDVPLVWKETFDKVDADMDKLMSDLLDMQREGGLLNQKSYVNIKEMSEHYIPLYKEERMEAVSVKPKAGYTGTTRTKKGPASSRITPKTKTDPDTKLMPLYQGLTRYINNAYTAVRINDVKLKLYDIIDSEPAHFSYMAKEVPSTHPVFQQVHKEFAEKAITRAGGVADASRIETDTIPLMVLADRTRIGDKAYDVVYRDGQPHVYEIRDESAWRMLTFLNRNPAFLDNPVLKTFATVKRMSTQAITLSPVFLARTFARDQINAPVFSKNNFALTPGIDGIRGAIHTLVKDEQSRNIILNGLSFGGITRAEEQKATRNLSDLVSKEKVFRDADKAPNNLPAGVNFVASLPKTAAKGYMAMANAIEMNMRIMEGRKLMRQRGYSATEAAFASREVGTDMSKQGSSTALGTITAITPFMQPFINSVARTVQIVGENPLRVASALTAVYGPLIAHDRYIMQDLPQYQEIPAGERGAFWFFPQSDRDWKAVYDWQMKLVKGEKAEPPVLQDGFLKIPNGYDIAAWVKGIHNYLDAIERNDGKQAGEIVLQTFISSTNAASWPQIIAPLIQLLENLDWQGRPIISRRSQEIQKAAPWAAYGANTRPTAIELGRALNLSPDALEHIAEGYLVGLASHVLDSTDWIIQNMVSDIIDGKEVPRHPRVEKRPDEEYLIRSFQTHFPLRNTVDYQDFQDLVVKGAGLQAVESELKRPSLAPIVRKEFIEVLKDPENARLLEAMKKDGAKLQETFAQLQGQRSMIIQSNASKEEKIAKMNELLEIRNTTVAAFMKTFRSTTREVPATTQTREWLNRVLKSPPPESNTEMGAP